MTERIRPTVRPALLLSLLAMLLAACVSGGLPGSPPASQAERLAERGAHEEAAAAYIGRATEATGSERDRLTLLAIEQWLYAGDGRRARNAMRSLPAPDGGELLWLWSSNAAALSLWEGRPDDAQRLLEPLRLQSLPVAYRQRVDALLADAWFQKGDPIRAIALYRQLERQLTGERDIERNRQRLWAGLLVGDPRTLRAAAERSSDAETAGWLSLAALATATGRQGVGWANGVARWQESHPAHPAMAILEQLQLPAPGELEFPRRIALLLPLSGNSAGAGSAVQNGFLGSYFAAAAELGDEQRVDVYDTNDSGGVSQAYARALNDGAEFVVGPLLRGDVMSLADQGLLPVPVLALNYLPDAVPAPAGLYQFALSPEDEAAAAARRALEDGRRRALALVPNNDWGRRLLASFASEFEARGGTLLAASDYQPGKQDFSFEIESLMLLSQSVQRYQRLRANLGEPLQFDPRRRQDAEFIFLAATAPIGRLLKSQLKFHYAGDLPVYSTSRIYANDGRSNADLNGLMFADTPWVIDPQPWIAELPALYGEFWPAERRLGRLHALGYDAYHLVAALRGSASGNIAEIDGATGTLYLDADGRVHRRLAWARFENGAPVPLAEPGRDDAYPGIDDDSEDFAPDEEFTWGDPASRQ